MIQMFDETKANLALEMRRKGDGYIQIALALGITEGEAREYVAVTLENEAREDEKVSIRLQLENMEKIILKLQTKAEGGDQGAVERLLKVLGSMDELNKRLEALKTRDMVPAFPASSATPGQGESRSAYAAFMAQKADCPWWEVYLKLREKWDWRKAALIAWSVMPGHKRLPPTQHALAVEVLGLKDDRVLRKWRENEPAIDQEIERMRLEVAGDALNDVLAAWTEVAKLPDPSAHRDRITFLEWKGVYGGQGIRLGGMDGNPVGVEHSLAGLEDGALEGVIRNLLVVAGGGEGFDKAFVKPNDYSTSDGDEEGDEDDG